MTSDSHQERSVFNLIESISALRRRYADGLSPACLTNARVKYDALENPN